jgi:alpha-glucosidase
VARADGVAGCCGALLGNDLVYRLASPLELQDVSWIRPGQSTEEVDHQPAAARCRFQVRAQHATYRYYIDFAAEYGVEYMMFDAGWSDAGDNSKLNPDIDVPGLIAYANSKGVACCCGTRHSP